MTSTRGTDEPVIVCGDVHKVYRSWLRGGRQVRALDGVSFALEPGQILGLIGPNGAGKTTLLSLIVGLLFPTAGTIRVCGHPARSVRARAQLGFMPEYPAFLGRYTGRQMLRYQAGLHGLRRRETIRRADELLEQVELAEAADRACYGYSQGMKQRLALGMALVGKPRVLILDEPSNGLDPVGIVQLRRLLKAISEEGTAMLVSSHRLGELEKLTSNYVFLNKGRVVSCDTEAPARQSSRLRVGLLGGGYEIAQSLGAAATLVEVGETEMILEASSRPAAADLVAALVQAGARIVSVNFEQEDVEAMFMRLYEQRSRS